MQYNKVQHFISAKECPFTFKGQNLVELRRVKLRPIAKKLKLPNNGTKNELLGAIIMRLKSLEVDTDIAEL